MRSLHVTSPTQWKNSDDKKVHLERLDFDAGGKYYCEVSTDTPIFTKESNIEQMHIVGELAFGVLGFFRLCVCVCVAADWRCVGVSRHSTPFRLTEYYVMIIMCAGVDVTVHQSGPPRITFSKRQFTNGENLVANCTTSKAHPAPHITWLINGVQVS